MFDLSCAKYKPTFIFLQSESPSEFELDALGIYLLGSLSFVVGALVEFAFVVLADRVRSTRTKEDKNRMEAQQVNNSVKNPTKQALMEDGMVVARRITATRPLPKNKTVDKNRKGRIFTLPSTNGIDFAAFWMYFFLYILFNLVYWFQFLQAMHL